MATQKQRPPAHVTDAEVGRFRLACSKAGRFETVGIGCSKPEHTSGMFLAADLMNAEPISNKLADIIAKQRPPSIVVHNTAELVIAPFSDTTLEDCQRAWADMVQSAAILLRGNLLPIERGSGGTVIASGATASLCGCGKISAFASAKFALRALAQSMARELGPKNIHVAHAIIDGAIDSNFIRENMPNVDEKRAEEAILPPEEIARNYVWLHEQQRSAWTHEIDLRPWQERW